MGNNSVPLLAEQFLYSSRAISCMPKSVTFSTSFRYIDDLFNVDGKDDFGNCNREIYPLELELKDITLNSDKREDLAFRIVNFPYMDSNIPANPA